MNAEQLFEQALAKVESESIRQWAQTEHNRPIWIKLAELALAKKPDASPDRFSTLIVCSAMGL